MLNTNANMVFESNTGNMEALLEVFFKVQADEHVIAWRWECYRTGNYHYWPQYSNCIVYGRKN